MGLSMSEKKAVTKTLQGRYQKATLKEKKTILDEFVATSNYNRKYALRVLNAKNTIAVKKPRPKNRKGKAIYTEGDKAVLKDLWKFYWFKCGKYLAVIMREQMPFLEASREPDFHITAAVKSKLLKISPATIDRLLKADKDALRGKGISGTKLGDQALLKQIPVRTHYSEQERNTQGFFQTDTVHHCGNSDSGEFNLTLTATDVFSGWTELRSLKNKAHIWTLNGLQNIYKTVPFTVREFHTDNGSEFINHDTNDWRQIVKNLDFTRSRSHHSNDNCYAEQKNNAFVRNYVGYCRFDTDAELAALFRVYEYLCPLLNYFTPNKKLISKSCAGSKTVKNYDAPKTPYQRLLASNLSSAEKEQLTVQYALYNPVVLQHNVHKAVNALLAANRAKFS